jgi:hypothetical protein
MEEYLPKEFINYDKNTQVKIVQLGISFWSFVQNEIDAHKDLNNSQLIELWKTAGYNNAISQKDKEIARLVKQKQDEIEDVLYDKKNIQKKLDCLEKDLALQYQKEFDTQKNILMKEARLTFLEEINALKEENSRLRLVQDFKVAYDFIHDKYKEQTAEIEELKQKIVDLTKVRSSFHLGKEGEFEIENYLKQISDFDYLNVNTEADKADFRLTSKDKNVIILDSKNFTHSVPKKDREKLIDNTDKDATVGAGIMVSLNSKISARQHCEIEFTPNSKPILYLCLQNMTSEARLHSIDVSLKLVLKLISSQNEKERNELIEKLNSVVLMINELKKKIENIKKNATEILETAKISLSDIKSILDNCQVV